MSSRKTMIKLESGVPARSAPRKSIRRELVEEGLELDQELEQTELEAGLYCSGFVSEMRHDRINTATNTTGSCVVQFPSDVI